MPRKNFKCTLSYKGTQYYGWQRQKQFATIQGLIEYALEKYFGFYIKTTGAGRTDAGVHAYGQICNFYVDTKLEGDNLKHILNNLLPDDIRIHEVKQAHESFNPRYNVKKKLYRYVIYNSKKNYPFATDYAWRIKEKLDIDKMKESLKYFVGEKDYFSFSKSGSDAKQFVRTIDSIKIKKDGKFIYIDYKSKGFLYQQIRRMMGVIVAYAKGEVSGEDIEKMFSVNDRTLFKDSAPPQGLYMVKIIYERKSDV